MKAKAWSNRGECMGLKENNRMIDELCKKNALPPEVVAVLKMVDREIFVPREFQNDAYLDKAIYLGKNSVIPSPSTVAQILSIAKVRTGLNILEIGCGTGYFTAILAELTRGEGTKITALENSFELQKLAQTNMKNLGIDFVEVVFGEPKFGYWNNAPYDLIIANYAFRALPREYVQQLKVDGKVVISLLDGDSQKLMAYERLTNTISNKPIDTGFPLLE